MTPQEKKSIRAIAGKEYIVHFKNSEWGQSIWVIKKDGTGMGRLYYMNEDMQLVLDNLSVEEESRKEGIGTKLQHIRELIGIYLGFKESNLRVINESWMHEWYKRREYVDYMQDTEDSRYIWMKKKIWF